MTLPEYVEDLIAKNADPSLEEAATLAVGNAELSERIARGRNTLAQLRRAATLKKEANALTAQGKLAEAETDYEKALEICRMVRGPENLDTIKAMRELANFCFSIGRSAEAITLLERECAVDPKDTDGTLTLATWQTWFGQDADYEITRRRLVQQAEGTDLPGTAERAAKAACLRPSTNAALLAHALDLARQGVELGRSNPLLPYYQLELGLAEYRNGQYAAAERNLAVAAQNLKGLPEIQGTARLFRALSLFRQDRPEEARKLFSQAEAQMPPLPKDESKPLLEGKPVSHDVLICWLAYKEAKSVLDEPAAAKP
jgi:tetratricopeptide (TPR) repeat protein